MLSQKDTRYSRQIVEWYGYCRLVSLLYCTLSTVAPQTRRVSCSERLPPAAPPAGGPAAVAASAVTEAAVAVTAVVWRRVNHGRARVDHCGARIDHRRGPAWADEARCRRAHQRQHSHEACLHTYTQIHTSPTTDRYLWIFVVGLLLRLKLKLLWYSNIKMFVVCKPFIKGHGMQHSERDLWTTICM